jgi:hypothetical protein
VTHLSVLMLLRLNVLINKCKYSAKLMTVVSVLKFLCQMIDVSCWKCLKFTLEDSTTNLICQFFYVYFLFRQDYNRD